MEKWSRAKASRCCVALHLRESSYGCSDSALEQIPSKAVTPFTFPVVRFTLGVPEYKDYSLIYFDVLYRSLSVLCDCLINDCIASSNVSMKLRNCLPHDRQLQEGKLAPPVLPKFEDPILAAPPQEEKKEDPFLNIAPKKPNWDLRRDVQRRLNKLERRTQKAMLTLMGWSFSFFGE
ncbi:hypothetical protein ACS0TY_017485 [Phlomoides rotata]